MPLHIIHQDITKVACDAIVNPTDACFSGRGGTDYAVHQAAGSALRAACQALPPLNRSEIAVTPGYGLPCKYILHTFGPNWVDGSRNEAVLLRSCYVNALLKAAELGAKSIAFPLISSGTFGFPKDLVLSIAQSAIRDVLQLTDADTEVSLCIYDRQAYNLRCGTELERYLQRTAPRPLFSSFAPNVRSSRLPEEACMEECTALPPKAPAPKMQKSFQAIPRLAATLEDWLKRQDDTFAVTLLKLIDQKGTTEVDCYKKANISRKTFWKIMNDPKYKPSKQTVLAFAIALELTLDETEELLKTVGFSLSHSSTFDMIVEFYIDRGVYDIYEINAALYQYDQVCLGA